MTKMTKWVDVVLGHLLFLCSENCLCCSIGREFRLLQSLVDDEHIRAYKLQPNSMSVQSEADYTMIHPSENI